MSSVNKKNGWRVHHVVVFKTKVSRFKFENTPMKDTNGKKKFKKMLIFFFVDKRELFTMKLCFEEFNLVFFAGIRALGLFWTNRGSEVSEETWGTFSTLWSRKVRLLKGIFVFIKVSWTFSTFWHWRERKTRKCPFEINFFAMRSADLTWVNGSRIKLVVYANCFLGLTYGFFNKNFQEIKLFISHFSS